jgi:stage IV sporulation protein B
MRRSSVFLIGAVFSSVTLLCGKVRVDVCASAETEQLVYVGGVAAGFTLKSRGAQVVGFCEVITEQGVMSPALRSGMRTGDKITQINGVPIEEISHLNEMVEKSKGNMLIFTIERGQEEIAVKIQPVKDKSTNRYKIGILAKDSVSGIGTVTYIDKEAGRFAALGHTVVGDNKKPLQISNGEVYGCSIIGVQKGVRGKAGELRGLFLMDKSLGIADKLCNCGIFGQLSPDFSCDEMIKMVASSSTVLPGEAYIYSTVDGITPQRYEVEIVKVDKNNKENKNYVIRVTDEDLLSETGGIVQGMRGSPIVQDGKLVGAITHVFINDPTRGYGIDIGTMLQE